MKLMWRGVVALSVAVAGLAAAAPAQAQYYGGGRDEWRGNDDRGEWDGGNRRWDGRRWDDRRDDRRWDDRRHWRGDRGGYYRPSYRRHCWSEWRYSRYYHQRVRVRICR